MASKILRSLFSGSKKEDEHASPLAVQGGATGVMSGAGYLGAIGGSDADQACGSAAMASGDGTLLIRRMPEDRRAKYSILNEMAKDPTIDSALKMHVTHALSAKADTGNIVSIDSVDGDENNEIVNDLRSNFTDMINQECHKWAYKAALFGWNPNRVYGKDGVGVTIVRDDYYDHPYFTRRYDRAGQLVGFSSDFQTGQSGKDKGMISLMPPWSFAEVLLPDWTQSFGREPIRHGGDTFDIANDDPMKEGFTESTDYGLSLIETAFEPWTDLQEAILSLNMSRKNASVTDRMVGVNTGKLNPTKAAEYLRVISSKLKKTAKAQADRSLRRGYIQTVWNNIFPIWGEGQGDVNISTIEGKPDIAHIEDIRFHVNRLGSALGIDPSLLGFGDAMSGGLGDGGFFRLSILAAMKAQSLRSAVERYIDNLFELHVAYKYGKVFLDNEKPWRILFNSQSTAIALEQAEERTRAADFATSVTSLLQLVDPELNNVDKNKYQNWMFTELMKIPEDQAANILAKIKEPVEPVAPGGDIITESVDTKNAEIRAMVFEILSEMEV